MEALSIDNRNACKAIIDSAGVLINTGSGVVIVTGSGAMIASGAGAVIATGAGAVNAAGAGSVNVTGVLAAQGTAKYDSSSCSAATDTFTLFGWTLARSASDEVPRPTSKKMSVFIGLVVDVAVRVSHKKKLRGRFGLRGMVDACVKCLVPCTRGATESASA